MNVARLAGLPETVVKRANDMSRLFEERLEIAHGTRTSKHVAIGVNDPQALDIELPVQLAQAFVSAMSKGHMSKVKELQSELRRLLRQGQIHS